MNKVVQSKNEAFTKFYWRWILTKQTSLYKVVYRAFLFNPNNGNLTTQGELFYHIFFNRADPAQFMNSLHAGGRLRHAGARQHERKHD